jgi:DNA polymerase-4
VEASGHFVDVLRQFSPVVEQYSIDEAWVDMTGTQRLWGPPLEAAERMRRRIQEELGFTVNIGISTNKLLAKTAGDFEKPNKIHTLYPAEVPAKMWPLPVRDLFLVGKSTEKSLNRLGIYTIGELANTDPNVLRQRLGKSSETLWHYANGRNVDILTPEPSENKGYSNSVTTREDITNLQSARQVLLSLSETVAARMRKDGKYGSCITVHMRTNEFKHTSHQSRLENATNITGEIFREACRIFQEGWNGTPLRQLGVQVTRLSEKPYRQYDLFSGISPVQYERKIRLEETVDCLREKYGNQIIQRVNYSK